MVLKMKVIDLCVDSKNERLCEMTLAPNSTNRRLYKLDNILLSSYAKTYHISSLIALSQKEKENYSTFSRQPIRAMSGVNKDVKFEVSG